MGARSILLDGLPQYTNGQIQSEHANYGTCADGANLSTDLTDGIAGVAVGDRHQVTGDTYRIWQVFSDIPLTGLPYDAVITSVKLQIYMFPGRQDRTFTMEMYQDTHNNVGTGDWLTDTALANKFNADQRMARLQSDSFVSNTWVDFISSAYFKTALQAAVDAGDTTFQFMIATNKQRLLSAPADGVFAYGYMYTETAGENLRMSVSYTSASEDNAVMNLGVAL